MSEPIIQCENLVKIYKTKDIEVLALQGLELEIEKGELMAIIGNSGSGKSTFLNMIGGLDRPSAGRLIVDGKDLFKLSEQELVAYKRNTVGFVWQNNARNLLPYLTAWQNVQLPMLFDSEKRKKERALELLEMVGMSHRKDHRLDQLSGGEQQRIAIAIALANNRRSGCQDRRIHLGYAPGYQPQYWPHGGDRHPRPDAGEEGESCRDHSGRQDQLRAADEDELPAGRHRRIYRGNRNPG